MTLMMLIEPRCSKNIISGLKAALASSLNIGCAIKTTFRGNISAKMGSMSLNCVVLQDDIAKMKDNLNEARIGCNKIEKTLKKNNCLLITIKVSS